MAHWLWYNTQILPLILRGFAWSGSGPAFQTHATLALCQPQQPLCSEPVPTSRSWQCASPSKSFPSSPWLVHFYSSVLSSKDTSTEWFSLATLSWPLLFWRLLPSSISHCINMGFTSLFPLLPCPLHFSLSLSPPFPLFLLLPPSLSQYNASFLIAGLSLVHCYIPVIWCSP